MKTLLRTTTFKKYLRRMQKRGKDFSEKKVIIGLLLNGKNLKTK
jgi:mRNA-degrading endonuclease YafQ of YafQ-DinJ toxin-antitoxin module